mmetsp:Transcript_15647/g.48957  ORF Transcript_15647/g.48957 Transcript_15647/m.48957 type:complete len:149 (+) Transcript_15647:65-511(+)
MESKDEKWDEGKGEGKEEEWIELREVSIRPSTCPLSAPLRLEVEFDALRPISRGSWKISFLVDTIETRLVVPLGETPPTDYVGNDCFFRFAVDEVLVADVEPSVLTNCGLLIAALETPDRGLLVKVQCVVEVSHAPNGDLLRTIYSPL